VPKEFLPLFVELSRPDGYWVISKLFLRYFKDLEKTLFLSELVSKYHLFKTKGTLIDGEWFYLTYDKIKESTYITIHKQRQIVKDFTNLGIIDTSMKGLPAKQYYRINTKILTILMSECSVKSSLKKSIVLEPLLAEGLDPLCAEGLNNKKEENKTEEREEEKYLKVLLDSENPIAKKPPLEKKPPKHPDPETYPKPVQELFNYWQSLKIVRHPASKTRTKGLNQLNTVLGKYSVDTVKKSMTRYKELLEDNDSILINEDPYKVGLDQFFGFNGYNKDRITRNLPKLEFVRSWFKECQKEDLTHLMRVRSNPYPEITTALKKGFSHKIGKVNGGTHNENAFRKASHLLMEFHSKHKEKLTLQLQKKPGIFASCLIDYLAEAPAKDGSKHPGWLCTDITWNVFKGWLTEKGYYCEEDLC